MSVYLVIIMQKLEPYWTSSTWRRPSLHT